MNVLDVMQGSSPGPVVSVWSENSAPYANGGAVIPSESVQYVDGLGGEVFRLVDSDVLVTGVTDFTRNRSFTIAAWFRGDPLWSTRRVVGRENGGTSVTLSVGRHGQAQAVVSSTAGNYTATLTGQSRVDDGRWHLLVLRARQQLVFGADIGGVDFELWVDDSSVRSGWIRPGVFGTRPQLGMSTPLIVGRSASGSAAVQADIGPVAAWEATMSDDYLGRVWRSRPEERRGAVGWGIVMG